MSTDHKASALEALEIARNAAGEGMANNRAFVAIAEATLHAAEQQRLANQIAYVSFLEMQYAESANRPEGFDWETREASVKRHGIVLAQIREGLGLA